MGLFSLAKLFGMTIRESATDGSDFTNPDADYRRLFLGEDGGLHLKDSAGTVTDIISANQQFTTIELGHASDTTLSRASAGVVAVEGTNLVKAGAATGSGLTMATARLLGRTTASTGAIEEITVGSGLSLSAGSLTATGGGGGQVKTGCKVYNSGTISLTNSTETLITFDSEFEDTDAFHDTGTNPGRITIPSGKDGTYAMGFSVRFSGNCNAGDYAIVYMNGTTITLAMQQFYGGLTHHLTWVETLAAGDYVHVYINQGPGVTTAAASTTLRNRCTFWAYLIGA